MHSIDAAVMAPQVYSEVQLEYCLLDEGRFENFGLVVEQRDALSRAPVPEAAVDCSAPREPGILARRCAHWRMNSFRAL